jgi:hypothetical protein
MVMLAVQLITAQDYKKVNNNFLLNRIEDAKTEIDKLMADPKAQGKAETFLWKGKIYAALYKDKATRAKYPESGKDADEALKKYAELDPTFKIANEKEGANAYFDMYKSYIESAIAIFNEKKWIDAGNEFQKALNYIDVIIDKKWAQAGLGMDTTSVLYAAICFQNGKDLETASTYYKKLADTKIADTNYVDVYRFLADYYSRVKKDEAQMTKYINLGREIFPTKDDWEQYEFEFMEGMTLPEKLKKYDADHAAGTLTEGKYLFYGEAFANARFKEELDSTKEAMYNAKAEEAFDKAYQKNNKNPFAAFNIGVINYNAFVDLDDKIRENIRSVQRINAEKPNEKDPKKKAAAEAKAKADAEPFMKANLALEAPTVARVDKAINWLEKAFTLLKEKSERSNNEKSIINKSIDWLANLYAFKRDKARGKDDKAFDQFEAKYKEFDSLHGKY